MCDCPSGREIAGIAMYTAITLFFLSTPPKPSFRPACLSLSSRRENRKMRALRLLLCALLVAAAAAQATAPAPSGDTGGVGSSSSVAVSTTSTTTSTATVFCPEPSTFFTGDGLTFLDCSNNTVGAAWSGRGVK